jgi:hypothetical protein
MHRQSDPPKLDSAAEAISSEIILIFSSETSNFELNSSQPIQDYCGSSTSSVSCILIFAILCSGKK